MKFVYRPSHPDSDENGMVDINLAGLKNTDPRFHVISDTMEPTRHMATGRYHTSKSKFRQDTKASGCIEWGSEVPKPRQRVPLSREQRRTDIQKAIYQIRNGRGVK